MIYLGTRGMTAISNLVLGSVATKVLHLADTPVVLVR
jgi:nucleotide-binding universal stress UspA family protein